MRVISTLTFALVGISFFLPHDWMKGALFLIGAAIALSALKPEDVNADEEIPDSYPSHDENP